MIKKGDKIRCVLPANNYLTVNKIYESLDDEVHPLDGDIVKVLNDNGIPIEYFTYRFEKVIDTAEQQNKPDMDDNSALLSSALASLELAQNALKKLQETPAPTLPEPEPIRWKPEKGQTYYFMDGSRVYWANDDTDKESYERGDVFQTKDEADAYSSYLIANADRHHCERLLMEAIAQANKENGDWNLDWENILQTKCSFSIRSGAVVVSSSEALRQHPDSFYFMFTSSRCIKELLGPQADRIIKIAITGKE